MKYSDNLGINIQIWNCNRLWKVWYGILMGLFQVWLLYNSIKQYIEFKSQYHNPRYGDKGIWSMVPLNFYLVCIILSFALFFFFLYFSIMNYRQLDAVWRSIKYKLNGLYDHIDNNDINEYDIRQKGQYCTQMGTLNKSAARLVKVGWPWESAIHWAISIVLLLPLPLIQREQIRNEVLPVESIWRTDLHYIFYNFIHSPVDSIYNRLNTVHYPISPPSISLEFINYTIASVLLTIRISAGFWQHNKLFSLIYSCLVFVTSLSWIFLYQVSNIIIKGAFHDKDYFDRPYLITSIISIHALLMVILFWLMMHYGYLQCVINITKRFRSNYVLPIVLTSFVIILSIISMDGFIFYISYFNRNTYFIISIVVNSVSLVFNCILWLCLGVHFKWKFNILDVTYDHHYNLNQDNLNDLERYELHDNGGLINTFCQINNPNNTNATTGHMRFDQNMTPDIKLLTTSNSTTSNDNQNPVYGCFQYNNLHNSYITTTNTTIPQSNCSAPPLNGSSISSRSSSAHIGSDSGLGFNTAMGLQNNANSTTNIANNTLPTTPNYVYVQHSHVHPTICEDNNNISNTGDIFRIPSSIADNNSSVASNNLNNPNNSTLNRKLVSFSTELPIPMNTNECYAGGVGSGGGHHLKVPDILNLNQSLSSNSSHSDTSSLDEQLKRNSNRSGIKVVDISNGINCDVRETISNSNPDISNINDSYNIDNIPIHNNNNNIDHLYYEKSSSHQSNLCSEV